MKQLLTPLAVIAILLAGCSGADSGAESVGIATTIGQVARMPDVTGMAFGAARDALLDARIDASFVGPDGETFTTVAVSETTIISTSIEAGSIVPNGTAVTVNVDKSEADINALDNAKATAKAIAVASESAKAEAAAKAEALAVRYEFTCSTAENNSSDENAPTFHAAADIWKHQDFTAFQGCFVNIAGEDDESQSHPTLNAQEQDVIDAMAISGGDVSSPVTAYEGILKACSLPPAMDWERSVGLDNARVRAVAIQAAKMCPKAPFIAELQRVADGIPPAAMTDGKYVVGKGIQAGTYQIQLSDGATGVSDCYWERADATGGTIDNDFINFAPQAPTVTVYDGEGFVSERCGTWKKIG